jgi:hypothetical protein
MFVKTNVQPGLSRRGTLYQTMGRWYDGAYVRWYEGSLFPIGAWAARTATPVTGKPRAIMTFRDDDGTRFVIVGTESKLYALTPSLTALVDITPVGFTAGHADAAAGGGYGSSFYGTGAYGTPRIDSIGIAYEATMWQLDMFGATPVMLAADDGVIYSWDKDIGTPHKAAAVSGAPTGNQGIVVTQEGFLVALGSGGARRTVAWSDRGNHTTWTPSSTNQAGDYDIQSQGGLMCGAKTRTQTLLFTELDIHLMSYVGLPNVYLIDRVGENCGAISRKPGAAVGSNYTWMSQDNFWQWDGASAQQLSCDVYDAVFSDMNKVQRSKISCTLVSQFSEIWWFYPSAASNENDMAVVYNYKEQHWNLHPLSRLCGADRGIYNYPIMCSSDGYLYDHENGISWDQTPFVESGPLESDNGDRIIKVRDVIMDERTAGDVELYVKAREWNNDSDTTFGPFVAPNPVDGHFAGRAMRMRVEFQGAGQWGAPRFDVIPGGRR